jgi:hypothetical protein
VGGGGGDFKLGGEKNLNFREKRQIIGGGKRFLGFTRGVANFFILKADGG